MPPLFYSLTYGRVRIAIFCLDPKFSNMPTSVQGEEQGLCCRCHSRRCYEPEACAPPLTFHSLHTTWMACPNLALYYSTTPCWGVQYPGRSQLLILSRAVQLPIEHIIIEITQFFVVGRYITPLYSSSSFCHSISFCLTSDSLSPLPATSGRETIHQMALRHSCRSGLAEQSYQEANVSI